MGQAKTIKVGIDQLKPGLYIDLELPWTQHPFLFRRFLIKTEAEISVIKTLKVSQVTVYPDRCQNEIPAASGSDDTKEDDAKQTAQTSRSVMGSEDKLWSGKQDRIDQAAQYRSQRHSAAKRYQETVKKVKNLTRDLAGAPANAMRDAHEVIEHMADAFNEEGDVLVNLVNLQSSSFSHYNHSLNVTVLSMLVGHSLGLEREDLHMLGLGAVLHDIGKVALPGKLLMPQIELSKSEQKLLQTHPAVGERLASRMQALDPKVGAIIGQHHEMIDGSGFPQGLQGKQIGLLARIVAIANLYDNLCNPPNPDRALTPKAAMALLFAKYKERLDGKLVQRFIQTMGVYPPGTVVELSDDSIGLVVAVDSRALLRPQVLLYNPDIPRNEALLIDLSQHAEIEVKNVLKPGDYPKRIYDYLGITERLGYFCNPLNPINQQP